MTLLRTAIMVSTATSVSETAVTTSTMSALPATIAWDWASDLWPDSVTELSASLSMAPNDGPLAASPAAPAALPRPAEGSARRAILALAPAEAGGMGIVRVL